MKFEESRLKSACKEVVDTHVLCTVTKTVRFLLESVPLESLPPREQVNAAVLNDEIKQRNFAFDGVPEKDIQPLVFHAVTMKLGVELANEGYPVIPFMDYYVWMVSSSRIPLEDNFAIRRIVSAGFEGYQPDRVARTA